MAIRSVTKPKRETPKPVDRSDYSGIKKMIKPVASVEQPMTALFYGKSGTGKTALLSTYPKPLLLLDIREKGTETIANIEGIDVFEVNDWDSLEKVYWLIKSGEVDYKTIGLDQISQLQGLAMDRVRAEGKMEATDTFSKRDWGQISGLMQTWLLNFRDLRDVGMNVVFLAHDRVRGGEDSEEDQLEPNVGARLMPSVSGFVNGMVSVIGNTFIREKFIKLDGGKKERRVQYCLRLGPHAYYDTKIRRPKESGPIPEAVVNPSYKKLLAISRGEDLDVKKTAKR